MVPALYQQVDEFVPIPDGFGVAPDAEAEEDKPPDVAAAAGQVCPEGQYGFIGRDADLLRIERALTDDSKPWVLLTGMGGIGKTDLAYGFARWYAETGGCPGGVFATSFKEKADFGQIIGCTFGHGTEFSKLSEDQQYEFLVGYLKENQCLLVLDNFETVTGYPEGSDALATEEDRKRIARFLRALRHGTSRVLITTRKPSEPWLRIAATKIEVGGLAERDAGQMAAEVLGTVGKSPEDFRDDPEYAALIRLLTGHPKSLEVVLPSLEHQSPSQVIAALQQRTDALSESLEDASLGHAFERMSERAQRHLPLLGLYAGRVHAGTVAQFVSAGDDQQEVYEEIMGESLDRAGWVAVLQEAARNGLVTGLSEERYVLHPTIPALLRRRLQEAVGTEDVARLDVEFTRFYAAFGSTYGESLKRGDENALAALAAEEANLLRALRGAETREEWASAQHVVQALFEFYDMRGRYAEKRAVRDRLLARTGRRVTDDGVRDDLRVYLLVVEANDAFAQGRLDEADRLYRAVLAEIETRDGEKAESHAAVLYHQLGYVAQEFHQLDKAEEWFTKALATRERLGWELQAAGDRHHLGMVAHDRGRLDEAEEQYRLALGVFERLGVETSVAMASHQLGMVAEDRGRLEEAEEWYRKALLIRERLGLAGKSASDYHHLGVVAQRRDRLDEAVHWYRKALVVYERLAMERDAAEEYHHLGLVAQLRGQLDEADQWYGRALNVFQQLESPMFGVQTLAQMGILRRMQNREPESVGLLGTALKIAAANTMSVGGRILGSLARLLRSMGEKAFATVWREAFDGEEPPLDALRNALEQLEDEDEGEENEGEDAGSD